MSISEIERHNYPRRHVKHELRSGHALEVPIIISAQSAMIVDYSRIFQDDAGLGIDSPSADLQRADPDMELNLTRPHYPDTSYQISLESDR